MPKQITNIYESDKIFRALFEYATVGIIVVCNKGIIMLANPFAEKLFGYKKNELKGQKLEVLIPDDLKQVHAEHHQGYFKNPKERTMGFGMDLFAKRKDGTLFPVEIGLGHYEIDGEMCAVTYITDIGLRKASEEDLKRSEQKYRFVFDNSIDVRAIYEVVFDDKKNVVDLIIREANSLYKEVILKVGIKGSFEGHSIKEMPGDYVQHFQECQKAMKTGQPHTYLQHNKETAWYMVVTIVPMDATHCFAYGVDITAQKKNEIELSKLNHELEERVEKRTKALAKAIDDLAESKEELIKSLEKEKELNELKSRFVTTASHEFRTPLATILSSASLIEKYNEKEDESKRRKHLQRIQSSVNNLIEILNDFLSIGKLEEGVIRYKPEPLQVGDFVKTIINQNRAILKKDQKVNYHHIDGNHNAEADLQMFKNVILNLLSNAAKYSEEGQPIDITTEVINGIIELKVKDHGIGIPEKDQKHLFERFFRAKNAMNIEGTGLGLNIVKKYVELMHGSISFTSTLEEGTEFTIRIPVKVK